MDERLSDAREALALVKSEVERLGRYLSGEKGLPVDKVASAARRLHTHAETLVDAATRLGEAER